MARGLLLILQISLTVLLPHLLYLPLCLPLVYTSPDVKATHDYIVPTGEIQNNLHILKSAAKFP